MDPQSSAPPVVAVVVTCDPGPWFDEALASLARQDYPNLSVLVVDSASSEDPTERVTTALPGAFVRRLEPRVGFGRAANEVIDVVDGASHYLICHDDVVLATDAVRLLLEEAYRSNAGIVSPKFVEWDRPERLLAVGMGVDKVGVVFSLVDPGELDQEQHDAVRDVFVAPSGAMLVRADLFTALGGFDAVVDQFGEDLDLSWRVQVAGARVLVAPDARVRHLQAVRQHRRVGWMTLPSDKRAAALTDQHRLRTLMACSGFFRLLWILPLAVFFSLGEALTLLARGRVSEALQVVRSLVSSVKHPRLLWRSRRSVQGHRTVGDRQVVRLQSRGNARLREFVRYRLHGGVAAGIPVTAVDEDADVGTLRQVVPSGQAAPLDTDSRRDAASAEAPLAAPIDVPSANRVLPVTAGGSWRLPLVAGLILLVVIGVGSRHLLSPELPAVGQIPVTSGGPSEWWRAWLSTWQPAGLGQVGPSAPALGLLSLAGWIFFGAVGTLQHVLVLGPLVVGPFGAYRAARWWGSLRGRVAALVVYATVAVPYNALARGDWQALLVFAAAPWVLMTIGRLSSEIPYPGSLWRNVRGRLIGLALLVALVSAFVPSFVFIVVVMGGAILVGSVVGGRSKAGLRGLAVAVIGAVGGAVLLLPWSADVLRSRVATFGVTNGSIDRLGVGQILRFHSGPVGGSVVGWGLLAAAALVLVIGRGWRLVWAARMWMVALAFFAWTWAGSRGWVPTPEPEVLLAPAAAALASAVALGVAAFELDLPGYRFGWRQLASAVAGIAVILGAVPVLAAIGSGGWDQPNADASSVLALPAVQPGGDYRVLWVGAPSALPLSSQFLSDGVGYATSYDGLPDVTDEWTTTPHDANQVLAADLRLAQAGDTTQLGHLLAVMGVRYIVIPNRNGPSGSGAVTVPTPTALLAGLALQTDLEVTTPDPDYTVYINAAWIPIRASLSTSAQTAAGRSDVRTLQSVDLPGTHPVLVGGQADRVQGVVTPGTTVYVAATRDRHWRLDVAGHDVKATPAFGWAMRFAVPGSVGAADEPATLVATTAVGDRVGQLVEVAVWILALAAVVYDRRRRMARNLVEAVRPEWFTPMAPGTTRGSWGRGSRSGLGSGDDDMDLEEVWRDA